MGYPSSYRNFKREMPESKDVITLLNYVEDELKGKVIHHSGHGKTVNKLQGALTYHFPNDTAVMIALNKTFPSIYAKKILPNNEILFDAISFKIKDWKEILGAKSEDEKGFHEHLDHSDNRDLLTPSEKSPVLLLSNLPVLQAKQIVHVIAKGKVRKPISPKELEKILDEKNRIGLDGELFAREWEIQRLMKEEGAIREEAESAVEHVALVDSSLGYDLKSGYKGKKRFIEVKTTERNKEADFFFTIHEFNVLKELNANAYIYRVTLGQKDPVIIRNPFGSKETDIFEAIAFKANLSDF